MTKLESQLDRIKKLCDTTNLHPQTLNETNAVLRYRLIAEIVEECRAQIKADADSFQIEEMAHKGAIGEQII